MRQTNIPLKMANIRQTTTFRLTLMYGMIFLVAIFGLLSLIYIRTVQDLTERSDQILFNETHRLVNSPERLDENLQQSLSNNTSKLNYFALFDRNGKQLAGDLPLPKNYVLNSPFEPTDDATAAVPVRILVTRLSSGQLLVVGRDISQISEFRSRIKFILLFSGLIVIILVMAAGLALSISPLRRIQHLTSVARRISGGELHLQMPVSRRGDELDLIAVTVNAMVEEIGNLMTQVKGATDAIAHDLRSPLAQVRSRLELLQRPDSVLGTPEQIENIITAAVSELDQVLSRFNALLRIAELEATNRRAGFGVVDPMTLIASVCELFEPWAEERSISLSISGLYGQTITGDEKLLFEAVSNLVENAIKFIPENGIIVLSVASDADNVIIEVRDNGSGIPSSELGAVQRRFYRGTSSLQTPGSGLGLSLVASIVRLHDFDLTLEDARPGLKVKIICPKFNYTSFK